MREEETSRRQKKKKKKDRKREAEDGKGRIDNAGKIGR
jgi:hypothetical protein